MAARNIMVAPFEPVDINQVEGPFLALSTMSTAAIRCLQCEEVFVTNQRTKIELATRQIFLGNKTLEAAKVVHMALRTCIGMGKEWAEVFGQGFEVVDHKRQLAGLSTMLYRYIAIGGQTPANLKNFKAALRRCDLEARVFTPLIKAAQKIDTDNLEIADEVMDDISDRDARPLYLHANPPRRARAQNNGRPNNNPTAANNQRTGPASKHTMTLRSTSSSKTVAAQPILPVVQVPIAPPTNSAVQMPAVLPTNHNVPQAAIPGPVVASTTGSINVAQPPRMHVASASLASGLPVAHTLVNTGSSQSTEVVPRIASGRRVPPSSSIPSDFTSVSMPTVPGSRAATRTVNDRKRANSSTDSGIAVKKSNDGAAKSASSIQLKWMSIPALSTPAPAQQQRTVTSIPGIHTPRPRLVRSGAITPDTFRDIEPSRVAFGRTVTQDSTPASSTISGTPDGQLSSLARTHVVVRPRLDGMDLTQTANVSSSVTPTSVVRTADQTPNTLMSLDSTTAVFGHVVPQGTPSLNQDTSMDNTTALFGPVVRQGTTSGGASCAERRRRRGSSSSMESGGRVEKRRRPCNGPKRH